MFDRAALVTQMAKAFGGRNLGLHAAEVESSKELEERAEHALTKVEIFLGIDIEEAKEIVTRVVEDVS
jgi:hypothetical protein